MSNKVVKGLALVPALFLFLYFSYSANWKPSSVFSFLGIAIVLGLMNYYALNGVRSGAADQKVFGIKSAIIGARGNEVPIKVFWYSMLSLLVSLVIAAVLYHYGL